MATPWRVPLLWPGRTVAVMASGPSMSPAIAEAVRAADLPAIAVNDTHRLAPWAAVLYAADSSWWSHHSATALHFPGLKATANDSVPYRAVHCLRPTGVEGFDPDPACLRTGGNGGYQALHLAVHAGAARVLLFGFDLDDRAGRHWHGDHPAPLVNTAPGVFAIWRARFATLVAPLHSRGVQVVNCAPQSALRCWPLADPFETLAGEPPCPSSALPPGA